MTFTFTDREWHIVEYSMVQATATGESAPWLLTPDESTYCSTVKEKTFPEDLVAKITDAYDKSLFQLEEWEYPILTRFSWVEGVGVSYKLHAYLGTPVPDFPVSY